MEKYLTSLYVRLVERWTMWKENTRRWLQRNRYKLVLLGFVALTLYSKDLQFTIGMNGYTLADFQALRPIPRLMSQVFSGEETEEDPGFFPISWDEVINGEKSGSAAPVADKVQLPAPRTEKQNVQLEYVKRFAQVAQGEMKKFGIPASITLAQGLLESDAGKSRLASRHNNHFGIKCHSRKCPKGHCVNYADDTPKDFFRQYGTAWESFRAHSEFLQRDRYSSLHKLKPTDYKRWAKGLERAGYATGKGYGDKLIRLIEDLKLYQYDRP